MNVHPLVSRVKTVCLLLFLIGSVLPALAHVGSPHTVLEGKAGAFPVRVVVRQPDVVPGLAEITVRVLEGTPTRVTALPMHWNTDKRGAPRADVARLVPGETNLYTSQLWLMVRGAYAIEVGVEGDRGGTLLVPVNSVAYDRRPMPAWLGWVTGALGCLLAVGVMAIAAAALREGTLAPGLQISARRRRLAWLGGAAGLLLVLGAIWGGHAWWRVEDDFHQSKVLFRPLKHTVALTRSNEVERLSLTLTDSRMNGRNYALMPDHGRLMHLFLIGEGDAPAFAHLHPARVDATNFTSLLPPLPVGTYHLFCDLTHETGVTETITNQLILSMPPANPPMLLDPQDSWSSLGVISTNRLTFEGGVTLHLQTDLPARTAEPALLRFTAKDQAGQSVALEPYLNMLGHAVVMKSDHTVFSHVHPSGTLSLAAARKFATKLGGEAGARATDAVCGDLSALPESEAMALGREGRVSFPYVFPSAGSYFLWVQVKVRGSILTGLFRVGI